jgi:DNA-binding response OmpR family regulator
MRLREVGGRGRADKQTRIIEVEISLDGALHISRRFRHARLGITPLDLSERSFDLLLMLAEKVRDPFVPLKELEVRFYKESTNTKALNQGMDDLKDHLERSGVSSKTVEQLIVNVRGKGYCLNMPPAEVLIED